MAVAERSATLVAGKVSWGVAVLSAAEVTETTEVSDGVTIGAT